MFRKSKRRSPVITGRHVDKYAFLISQLCRGKYRLQLSVCIDPLIKHGSTVHQDIGQSKDIGVFQ